MLLIAELSIGFSLGAVLLLIAGNLLQTPQVQTQPANPAGLTLLAALSSIQLFHLHWLHSAQSGVQSSAYLLLLYSIAPSFYFYSRRLLIAQCHYQRSDWLHAIPLLLSVTLPYQTAQAGAFLIGSAYLLWLAKTLYVLRAQRRRFQLELLALAILFSIAIAVLLLGFVKPLLDPQNFIIAYSLLISLAFFALILTLLRFPSIAADVGEAVRAAYAESTLKQIDKAGVLRQLDRCMSQDKLYRLESLDLSMLAEQLQITTHQLSELINTEFKQGFSRYIRQQRINEAKQLLLADSNASVLSIGMQVGFNTQSNFYAAFRELEGIAPGQYRKHHAETVTKP
jgi:AraC-like DNA-binding protein